MYECGLCFRSDRDHIDEQDARTVRRQACLFQNTPCATTVRCQCVQKPRRVQKGAEPESRSCPRCGRRLRCRSNLREAGEGRLADLRALGRVVLTVSASVRNESRNQLEIKFFSAGITASSSKFTLHDMLLNTRSRSRESECSSDTSPTTINSTLA